MKIGTIVIKVGVIILVAARLIDLRAVLLAS